VLQKHAFVINTNNVTVFIN